MDLASGLRNSLKDHLGWGKPRLTCFVSLLLAVLRIQRMDLSRLAVAMGSSAEVAFRYRRLQRFFSEVRFDYDALARLIVCLFGFDRKPFYLTLDRTNWQWGKKNLNLLTLGIVYKGAAIPASGHDQRLSDACATPGTAPAPRVWALIRSGRRWNTGTISISDFSTRKPRSISARAL